MPRVHFLYPVLSGGAHIEDGESVPSPTAGQPVGAIPGSRYMPFDEWLQQ